MTNNDNVCRICMSKDKKVTSIFSSIIDYSQFIHEIIMACAPVQIYPEDGLPSFICNKCLINLHIAYRFRSQCVQTDKILRQNINVTFDIKSEIIIEELQQETVEDLTNKNETNFQSVEINDFSKTLKELTCKYCQDTFISSAKLTAHLKVHSETKHYECKVCSKSFTQKKSFLSHSKMHSEKDFSNKEDGVDETEIFEIKQEIDSFDDDFTDDRFYDDEFSPTDDKSNVFDIKITENNSDDVFSLIMGDSEKNKNIQTSTTRNQEYFEYSIVTVGSNDRYQCSLCNSHYKWKSNVKRHFLKKHKMQENQENCAFKCSLCDKSFKQMASLNIHLKYHTGKENRCSCGKIFNNRYRLNMHRRIHAGKCPFCSKIFNNTKHMQAHIRIHSSKKKLIDRYNKFQPKRAVSPKKLQSPVDSSELHTCETCGKGFKKKSLLDIHQRYHKGEKNFCCEHCGKTFFTASSLNSHLINHSGIKLYKCEFCPKSFAQKIVLKNHTKTHTKERPYMCEVCGKSFGRKNYLTKHSMIHADEKKFGCEYCSKSFTQKVTLKNHIIKIHMTERQEHFECKICLRSFNSKRYLTLHNKSHIGNEDEADKSPSFKCDICGKYVKHLDIHKKYHGKGRNFNCDRCEKTFKRNSDLQRHIQAHIGLKLYRCHFCSKTFMLNKTLQNHIRTHTGERPFSCEKCGKSFSRKDHLKAHSATHSKKRRS